MSDDERLAAIERRCDNFERTVGLLSVELQGIRTANEGFVETAASHAKVVEGYQQAYAAAAQRADHSAQLLASTETKSERTASQLQRRIEELERHVRALEAVRAPEPPPAPPASPEPLSGAYASPER